MTSSITIFVVITILSSSMGDLPSGYANPNLPCNQLNPCKWNNYITFIAAMNRVSELECKGKKLQCCYKKTSSSCTVIDGFNVNGTCDCVRSDGELLDMSHELETSPGQGCLNHKQCISDPAICPFGSHCDCKVDYRVSHSGKCEHSRAAKCRCSTGQATSG